MQLRTNIHGGQVRVPTTEFNYGKVYVRFNVTRTEEVTDGPEGPETVQGWQYDEWFMTSDEYAQIQQGILPYGGHWDDALRGIERAYLYREADDMLSKYSTDEPDQEKYDAWKSYKHFIRLTQNAPGYPLTVEYPPRPE